MRLLKTLGLLFLILVAAAVVALFVMGQVGKSKLASRGGGAIPAAVDLEYPELTDSENAALLYWAAWGKLEATPEGTDNESIELITKAFNVNLARDRVGEEPYDALSESDLEFATLLLSEAEPAFELLRQVRTTKGCLFFQDHSPEAVDKNLAEFMEIGAFMRNLARYVAARARWESEQGNTDAALDWLTTGLHIANDLNDESVLIGELVRIAIGNIMLSSAQTIFYNRPLPEQIPQALLDELDDLRDRNRFGDSLRREGVLSEARSLQWRVEWWNPLPAILSGNYLEALGTFIEAVETDDYTDRTLKLAKLSDDVARTSIGIKKYFHIFEATTIPALLRAEESLDTLIAKIDLLELSLSLRAYEQTHGAFPDTLAELTPEYLAAIPEDPLNGKDYIYEKAAERVTVRSGATTPRREIAFHLAPAVQASNAP
ncbi:MAG: hypothetical protein QGD90_02625 [Candidatus Hydrogenedentes bacterium]|nr:hypothetical protein [Candidatus Hydrogenedentota bacterium]